jgi:Ras-related GTP-binding protein C/D
MRGDDHLTTCPFLLNKVYIATDSEPVNMSLYELCSDMVDVVVDVSCIYGFQGINCCFLFEESYPV